MKTLSERHRQFAIRAAYWALPGAIAGATASAGSQLHYHYRHSWAAVENPLLQYASTFSIYIPPPVWMYFVPGALFGIALSFAIRREGLATWWQAGAFIAFTALASYVSWQIARTWFYGSGEFSLLRPALHGAFNAAAAAAVFPFARRLGPALALLAAGPITFWLTDATQPFISGLLFKLGLSYGGFGRPQFNLAFMLLFMFYAAIWHAVQAAILSTTLPVGKDSAATEIWRLLPRVFRWAVVGAISGGAGWVMAFLFFGARVVLQNWGDELYRFREPHDWPDFVLALTMAGIGSGTFMGLALYRRGLAGKWQVAALVTVFVLALNSGLLFFGLLELFHGLRVLAIPIAVGGLVIWSVVQTAGTAAIFPFARRPGLWLALIGAGVAMASLILLAIIFGWIRTPIYQVFFILWMSWYAVQAAILSTALPLERE